MENCVSARIAVTLNECSGAVQLNTRTFNDFCLHRLRLQTYEQYCTGDETCTDHMSSMSSGQTYERCLEALVDVQGSVLTLLCVCSSQDEVCDAARRRLPHKPSPCAGTMMIITLLLLLLLLLSCYYYYQSQFYSYVIFMYFLHIYRSRTVAKVIGFCTHPGYQSCVIVVEFFDSFVQVYSI